MAKFLCKGDFYKGELGRYLRLLHEYPRKTLRLPYNFSWNTPRLMRSMYVCSLYRYISLKQEYNISSSFVRVNSVDKISEDV